MFGRKIETEKYQETVLSASLASENSPGTAAQWNLFIYREFSRRCKSSVYTNQIFFSGRLNSPRSWWVKLWPDGWSVLYYTQQKPGNPSDSRGLSVKSLNMHSTLRYYIYTSLLSNMYNCLLYFCLRNVQSSHEICYFMCRFRMYKYLRYILLYACSGNMTLYTCSAVVKSSKFRGTPT
jgi:hypothetical protein